ncbi:F-box domain containing protein [Tanacetum coccineum]
MGFVKVANGVVAVVDGGVPSLNIDFTRKVKEPYTLFHKNDFKEFVDRVLGNIALDLDSFSLKCPLRYDMSTIGHWIDLVVMKKVKQLDLAIWVEEDDVMLPHCLVDCDSLKVLKLDFFGSSLSLESFTGSKTLKIFELDNVELLDHDLVHSFLVNCQSLEDLSLINCSTQNLDYLDISCPNLKTLEINNQGLDFDEEKSLSVIEVQTTKDYELGDDNFVADLFAQVSHVEHLSINHDFIKEWSYLRGGLTTIDRDYGRIITRRTPQSPVSVLEEITDFIMERDPTNNNIQSRITMNFA